MRNFTKQRLATAGLVLLLAIPIALAFVGQEYLERRAMTEPWSFRRAVSHELSYWYLWAALVPVIIPLGRRFPFERQHIRRNLLVHVVAGIVLALCHELAFFLVGCPIDLAFGRYCQIVAPLRRNLPSIFTSFNVALYWLLLFATQAFDYRRRCREGEYRLSQMEAQLVRAQLQALKMQLNPHFLFNTLHAISTLMYRDVESADRMIARLSELLRVTLENVGQQEVPLHRELDFLRGYLEIEQARFGERLTVKMEIDPDLLDAQVPNLILQPLVENAIRHGIAPRVAPGWVRVRADRDGDLMRLQVIDNGPGMGPGPIKEGIGLSNVRTRLKQLYGAEDRFRLRDAEGGGLEITLLLPLRLAPPERST